MPITSIYVLSSIVGAFVCSLFSYLLIQPYLLDILLQISFSIVLFFFFFKIFSYCIQLQCGFFTLLYILAMTCVLLFPIIAIDDATEDIIENRVLAKKPLLFNDKKFNYNFANDMTAWLSDHFYKRERIIKLYNELNAFLEQKVTGKIENNKAFIGKEDWIFYKAEGSVANFQNTQPFSQEELQYIKEAIEKRKEWLQRYGIAYYIIIPPDKHRIYSEYYPDGIFKLHNIGKAEQLYLLLQNDTTIPFIYPYQALIDEKKNALLYWKTDTHWNEYGAFIGYSMLMNIITKEFPDITPLTYDDFIIKEEPFLGGDLLNMIYMAKNEEYLQRYRNVLYPKLIPKKPYDFIYTLTNTQKRIVTSSPKKYSVLVFRDSFTGSMIPYLSQTFGNVDYIWDSNMNKYNEEIIKKKPDIVIFEMVERYIHTLGKNIMPKEYHKE